jgi:hypothetical protein
MPPQRRGKRVHVNRDEVMRHEVAHALEPKRRQLRQDLAFVGDAAAEDVIERGDPIRRDDQQIVAGLVDVADLAAADEREVREGCLEERCGEHRRG